MGDAIEIEQVVTPAVPVTVRQATLLQVEKSATVPVTLPTGARPGVGGISVDWKASLGDAALLEVRKWMRAYPFICLEQKTSKLAALGDRACWDALMRELPKYLDGILHVGRTCRGIQHKQAGCCGCNGDTGFDTDHI